MKEIKILSFAKINLSIDVLGTLPEGMHQVDMIMQQISFHDDVTVKYKADLKRKMGDIDISLTTNKYYLPTDNRNLAYKAAQLMIDRFGKAMPGGNLDINVFKRIPVAAGLAGGSGNGAAVLHSLNVLWKLGLSMEELCKLGSQLGSDVPFCIMGQGRCNFSLPKKLRKNRLSTPCARAMGTGTLLEPLKGIRKAVVIAKPPISVSTKEVYQGIDRCKISQRPDNDKLISAMEKGRDKDIFDNFINVLEEYTLAAYPEVKRLKELFMEDKGTIKVLMSGSGPTVFAIYDTIGEAKESCNKIRKQGFEGYWTKTTK